MFNQSHIVDSSSRFLICYNIIEICNYGSKHSEEKFKQILKGKIQQKKYNEALQLLLLTIDPIDHKDFSNKWKSLSGNLVKKPMKSPLLSFFEKQNLNPSSFPISVNGIKELRDNIIHGSIDKIDYDLLEKANILLYRITGILILNLIGIYEWELNTEF